MQLPKEAGHLRVIDKLGKDDRRSPAAECSDHAVDDRDQSSSLRHLERGAVVEKALLHVDDD